MSFIFEQFVAKANSPDIFISSSMPLDYKTETAQREISVLLKDVRILVLEGSLLKEGDSHTKRIYPSDPTYAKTVREMLESAQTEEQRHLIRSNIQATGCVILRSEPFTSETIDLPFKTVFIEGLHNETILENSTITDVVDFSGQSTSITHRKGLLVHEVAPESYKVFSFVEERVVKKGVFSPKFTALEVTYLNDGVDQEQDRVISLLYITLKRIFDKIRTTPVEYGSEQVNIRYRSGSGVDRKLHKVKTVVHIRPKRFESSYLLGDRKVDWSHRWDVRGHWRRVTGIGKDRDGMYTVKGFTWVMPHVRGPEDRDFIKKIRLVHGSAEI